MQILKTQEERLDYLLQEFIADSPQYRNLKVEGNYKNKRMALRSLMNMRMPREMPEDIVKVQDEFLAKEISEKGIVKLSDIKNIKEQYGSRHPFGEKLSIWQGDITRLSVDAVVNAANSQMLGCFIPCHRCIDNAIHSAAGIELRAECSQKMNLKRIRYGMGYEEPTGQAMLTMGYNLPAKYVIHTVGPVVVHGLTRELKQDLENCYESVLKCCIDNDIRSVAFCCISTGEFHFPNDAAAEIAVDTVTSVLKKAENKFDRIIFNVFKDMDREYYEELLK